MSTSIHTYSCSTKNYFTVLVVAVDVVTVVEDVDDVELLEVV